MNVPQKQRSQGLAHSLYSSSKIAVEFEDEDGLKELCLELRELEEEVREFSLLRPQAAAAPEQFCFWNAVP